MPKLFADGAAGFRAAAAEAVRRIGTCDCSDSCHRCLRDFWNQRLHGALNRFEVLATLRRLAGSEVIEGLDPEDDRLESFLEQEFFTRLKEEGLPLPSLQVVREISRRRIIRVDCEYRKPDISIFLDGRTWHAKYVHKIADDLEIRNQVEARGVCVLEYGYRDVMEHFERIAGDLRRALGGTAPASGKVLASRPGWTVEEQDPVTNRAVVVVDPAGWVESEEARLESLRHANAARLEGWRLRRVVQG